MKRFVLPCLTLTTALLAPGLAQFAALAQPTNAARSVDEFRAQIGAHVTDPRFNAAIWGIRIESLDTGKTLFEHHADRLMSPASNSKLYVGALALDWLGGDYRIVTPILATAKPDRRGKLKGDVIVSGRGDPSWKPRPGETNFWSLFDPFVAALTNAGVRRITGDIVADATFFKSPPHGSGWVVDDLEDYEGGEISAVTLADNVADLRVTPGAKPGEPCALAFVQPHTGIALDNRTVTTTNGGPRHIEARRMFGEATLHVFGELPADGTNALVDVPVPRPARWFAGGLKEALARHGIRVDGKARSARWPDSLFGSAGKRLIKTASSACPEPTPSPSREGNTGSVRVGNSVPLLGGVRGGFPSPNYFQLGEIPSPPLRDLVKAFMKPSQNLETDLVFAHVGEAARPADAPAWRTSEQCAVAALEGFLRTNGLPVGDVHFEEGSGLSRNNLTTANATLALLKLMATKRAAVASGILPDVEPGILPGGKSSARGKSSEVSRSSSTSRVNPGGKMPPSTSGRMPDATTVADDFINSLPVAGVDGTLRRRMKGTPAEGNVRAKTGTLRWANALSGYVTSAAGERLVFSVMLNRNAPPPGRNGRGELDAIAVMLAGLAARTDASPDCQTREIQPVSPDQPPSRP